MAGGGERPQGLGRSGGGSVLFRRAGFISSAYVRGFDQESKALGEGIHGWASKPPENISPIICVFPYYGKGPKAFTNFPKALRI